jgi:hypothetical protein
MLVVVRLIINSSISSPLNAKFYIVINPSGSSSFFKELQDEKTEDGILDMFLEILMLESYSHL